jgi:[ribosomal protein S5]-alanine N-acetyltransferase
MMLRPLEERDRAAFIRMYDASEAHLAPWMPAAEDSGLSAGIEAYFELNLKRATDAIGAGTSARYMGFAPDGRIAGSFNLNNIIRGVGQMADAGWFVSAEFAGQGYATEGVRALLDAAFAPQPIGLGLHRVQAGIIPRNVRSIRVAEKCGMRREGMALRYIKIAGKWEDHLIYAITVEEHVERVRSATGKTE